jgi:hypothetical protein
VKRILTALVATTIAAGALPALAAFSLNVPLVAAVPASASSIPSGAVAKLDWNSSQSRSADEPATATLVNDGKYLYVRFDVAQSAPLIGGEGGDNVAVDLWPNGQNGDQYRLGIAVGGARTADSTANTAGWEASESTRTGGYSVTMKIPMSVLPNANDVRAQFSRWTVSTGELQVWAHGAGDTDQTGSLTLGGSVGAATPTSSEK